MPAKRKPAKRRRSFGNVRKLPSGRWQAWYRLDGEHHTAESTFRTQTDAKDWLTTVSADLLRGVQLIDAKAGRKPFGVFAEEWFERRSRAVIKPLAETTKAKYRRLLDGFIFPTFKDYQISKISGDDVQDWFDAIAREHRTTASDAYRLLSTILRYAIKDKVILISPCAIDGASTMPAKERPTIEYGELQQVVNFAPERYRLAFLLAGWCGLRRGELLGLRRNSIDLVDNSIKITETWVAVSGDKPLLKAPKSNAGKRIVYMPPHVAEAMTAHLEKFVPLESNAWLFGTASGTAISPRNLSRAWINARTKAKRPDLHIHDLRHTFLTRAAQAGATDAELQSVGGHSSYAATRRYQQAEQNRLRALAVQMGHMASNGVK